MAAEASGRVRSVSEDVASVAERLLESVVLVRDGGGAGSGVVWSADGLIVTNSHVVRRDTAHVELRSGEALPARLESRHPSRDLATLRVQAEGLMPAVVGDSTRLRVGEVVLAAGNPLGIKGAVTTGIVTAVGQSTAFHPPVLGDHIQADVALAPGNSGGPLADARGRVLGVNSLISGSGVALAIPSHVVEDFVSPRSSSQTYLGISGVDVSVRVAQGERAGVLLTSVDEGGPADRAGLIQGDVLLEFNKRRVGGAEDLRALIRSWESGAAVSLTVLRGGVLREFVAVPSLRVVA